MTTAITTTNDPKREAALLKAVGLDRAAPEQRELAFHLAQRYELDLFLRHIVMVDGKPYFTRDANLHIAHRSGQLDGIEVTEPLLEGDFWKATCSVWRKDMAHPFTYTGRYPANGGNKRFAPEMATKVAESMALRRAFDIAAPSADERWDVEQAPAERAPRVVSPREAAVDAVIETVESPEEAERQERIAAVRAEVKARKEGDDPEITEAVRGWLEELGAAKLSDLTNDQLFDIAGRLGARAVARREAALFDAEAAA